MIDAKVLENWAKGITNMARKNRVPEGFVRDLLNLDPASTLQERVGYEKVYDVADPRAIGSVAGQVVVAAGTELLAHDPATGTTSVIANIAGAGPVAMVEWNNELFISTANATLRYDGTTLREWGVPDVLSQPAVAATGVTGKGRVLVAVTYTDPYGDEGGTSEAISIVESTAYEVVIGQIPSGCEANIYVSAVNGATLYLQRTETATGTYTLRPADGSGRPLMTMHKRRPPVSELMVSWHGVVVLAEGSTVWVTDPFSPHLVVPSHAFFQDPTKVNMLAAGRYGVYVGADHCYRLSDIESESPNQTKVMSYGAMAGTGTILPDGRAIWMTRYGMAIESQDPREGILEPNKGAFVPREAEGGTTGVVDHNGNQMAVATLRQPQPESGLAATDFFEAEVIRP